MAQNRKGDEEWRLEIPNQQLDTVVRIPADFKRNMEGYILLFPSVHSLWQQAETHKSVEWENILRSLTVFASLSCSPNMAILMFPHYTICLITVLSKQANKENRWNFRDSFSLIIE